MQNFEGLFEKTMKKSMVFIHGKSLIMSPSRVERYLMKTIGSQEKNRVWNVEMFSLQLMR